MSRQHKQRNKRTARFRATFDFNEKGERVGKKKKGPARTHPTHGKRNTWYREGRFFTTAMRKGKKNVQA